MIQRVALALFAIVLLASSLNCAEPVLNKLQRDAMRDTADINQDGTVTRAEADQTFAKPQVQR